MESCRWHITEDGDLLVASFQGRLSAEAGRASAVAFAQQLDRPRPICFNVGGMNGYEGDARRAWQELLWPKRDLIEDIRLRGGTPIVTMGATLLASFLEVPLVKEAHDIQA